MKLISTASQTVGPFFSIGLAPLCQNAATPRSADAITIQGKLSDGDGKPIPDAVLEFWSGVEFARVSTSDGGAFSVILNPLLRQSDKGARNFEVLVFMRGLLKPVYTRAYLATLEALRNEPTLKAVPTERIATLAARPTKLANEYEWNIHMQGENETVFFEY